MTNTASYLAEPIFDDDGIIHNNKRNTAITYSPNDRDDDVDMKVWADRLAWPMVIGILIISFSAWFPSTFPSSAALPLGLAIMGMSTLWLMIITTLWTCEERAIVTTSRWIAFILLVIFVLLTIFSRNSFTWILLAVLTIVIGLEQVARLGYTLLTCPWSETSLQQSLYGALKVVYVIATLASLTLLVESLVESSSKSSFFTAVPSILFFAYAASVASLITGTRGTCAIPTIIFSCRNISGAACIDVTGDPCCAVTWPILVNIIFVIPFVLVWPSDIQWLDDQAVNSTDWESIIQGQMIVLATNTVVIAVQALLYKGLLSRACQFHVRSDGAILVETMSKTYVYDNIVRAKLEPCGVVPKHTEMCHVYAGKQFAPVVLMKQSNGRMLCLTPELPGEFTNAVTRALRSSSSA